MPTSDVQGGLDDFGMCIWCQRLIARAYMTRMKECCSSCAEVVKAARLLLSRAGVRAHLTPVAAAIKDKPPPVPRCYVHEEGCPWHGRM